MTYKEAVFAETFNKKICGPFGKRVFRRASADWIVELRSKHREYSFDVLFSEEDTNQSIQII